MANGYRVSIRFRDGKYEIYKHYFLQSDVYILEEIIFRDKNLREVIKVSNIMFGLEDEYEE